MENPTFDLLNENLKNILRKNGFENPTDIQKEVLKNLSWKNDFIGISKTGSGKTLAFLLPALNSLFNENRSFHTLIIVPSRELALQINNILMSIGEEIGMRISLLIGGEDFNIQKESLKNKPHIIIGTPGRVSEHRFDFSSLRYIIFDEGDKLMEKNFKPHITKILENSGEKKKYQILFFSATICQSMKKLFPNAKVLTVKSELNIKESFIFVPYSEKPFYLYYFLKTVEFKSMIIFVSSKITAKILSQFLQEMKITNRYLNSDLEQKERETLIEDFRENRFNILIATDILSRGFDFPDIDLIINYSVTADKLYRHRVGRTARGGRNGTIISFVSQYEMVALQKLEYNLNYTIEQFSDFDFKNYSIEDILLTYKNIAKERNTKKKIRIN